jgi:hypothetical protein
MNNIIRTTAVAFIAGLLLATSLVVVGTRHASQSSAIAAPPEPAATYVSELGPASVQPPRLAPALPVSGSGFDPAGLPWTKFAGLSLAIGGALLVHAALNMRPRTAAHS